MEKKNFTFFTYPSRFIHSLFSESGSLLLDSKEIREREVSFDEKLYKSEYKEDKDVEQFFFQKLPKVSKKQM